MIVRRNNGFSLVEILVALGIFSMLVVLLGSFQRDLWTQNSFIQHSLLAESEARAALKNMIAELRAANPGNDGSYPLAYASSTAITFFTDVDRDGDRDRVRYYLQGNNLMRGVIKITSFPAVYSEANERSSTVVHTVTNAATGIFKYYSDTYDGVSATSSLPFPIDIPQVRMIGVMISIDADPVQSPMPMSFESRVTIRNLKDNL